MIEAIKQTQKRYCSLALMVAIVASFILIMAGFKAEGKGLVLGTLFSIINFIFMGMMLPARVGKSRNQAVFISLGSIFLRYGLLAIPMILAIKHEQFSLVTAIIGIFFIQLVILSDHIFNLIHVSGRKQLKG
jgi:hypothetical protein